MLFGGGALFLLITKAETPSLNQSGLAILLPLLHGLYTLDTAPLRREDDHLC
jgi:hypothetical protein